MPKKTAYSRSGAQRSHKPKQKSFELVRPVSDETVPETVEKSEEVEEAEADEVVLSDTEEAKEIEEPEAFPSVKEKVQTEKRSAPKESIPSITITTSHTNDVPQSAAARLAARRQNRQKEKPQRSGASLITAENYAYVRKDLVFILILAIVMFSAIIIMHFIPAIGG